MASSWLSNTPFKLEEFFWFLLSVIKCSREYIHTMNFMVSLFTLSWIINWDMRQFSLIAMNINTFFLFPVNIDILFHCKLYVVTLDLVHTRSLFCCLWSIFWRKQMLSGIKNKMPSLLSMTGSFKALKKKTLHAWNCQMAPSLFPTKVEKHGRSILQNCKWPPNNCEVWWENNQHFATPPTVSPRNIVRRTSTEFPYWWHITTQIWVVMHHQYGISALRLE